ncbi:hypothetical protein [Streptomyces sp. NPDC096132]|uniref:hypothetical protein n=1 Tax=Streptomyces sp. NPDC096132 TaxID=3366075 RepID=UPI0038214B7C
MWNQISPALGIVNVLVAGFAVVVCLKAIRLASASAKTARRAAEDAEEMRHMAARHVSRHDSGTTQETRPVLDR